MNTKPFERLWKWKRKENVFDFKERRREGKSVLFLSVRKREIETKKVPFYREKGHLNEAIKVIFLAEEREEASLPTCFYLKQSVKAEWVSVPIGIQQHQKDRKIAMKWLFFCLFFTTHQQDMCFQTQRRSK
ncbi:hypothetical protein [Hoylesella nanceiensis]|uniref:hypothetical protein n=1 Tax=Hoylesella nanceiensis TaxID=425941 RepID=UPI00288B09DB|nr:hypothetical protein [Hoylesella nanceiensis]